jgi:hypothetical protein
MATPSISSGPQIFPKNIAADQRFIGCIQAFGCKLAFGRIFAFGVSSRKQAAHRIAVMQASATKIDASTLHVCSFVRETLMCWWLAVVMEKMWWWIASFGYSFLYSRTNVLQHAKQIFSRIPQMTKYCVMRECENIQSWILYFSDLVFSHQGEIYGFKFPSRFLFYFFFCFLSLN